MDDEPILDCIVVATGTEPSSTMAPEKKPSTTAGHDAGKVHDSAARDGPRQSQATSKSLSSSTVAIPESRHIQGKKIAGSSAASKEPSPAFPSTCPPAKQSPSSSTVRRERPPKRNYDDAFLPDNNRDLGKQPVRYSQDPSDAKNRGQTESRHTLARLEVISISSDDEEPDSDDEPLAVIRKRKTTSSTPNPSGSQQKKPVPAKVPSRTSSSTPNTGSRSKYSASATRTYLDREKQELRAKIEQQATKIDALVSEKDSLNQSITKLRDEVSQEKEDANQSLITHKHRETELQKLLDDQVTKYMDLEATVRYLQKAEYSKTDGAKITKLEASNRELKKRGTQLEGEISQTREDNEKIKGQRDRMLEEKEETKAERDRLQLRLLELELQLQQKSDRHALSDDSRKREVEELQKQVSSQDDEIREYEKQVSTLQEEVEWYKGNRERVKKEWEERVAMETTWRENLQAVINNHG